MKTTVARVFTLILVPGLALSAALTACNFATDSPVIVITATPSSWAAAVSPEPTIPYVTPTPIFVPTPTLPPNVALADAQQSLRNGDYIDAVTYYQAVLDQPQADPGLRVEAAYGLGEAALREGLYSQAVAALTAFLDSYPGHERTAHALYLRGEAHMGVNQWGAAIADFKRYLELRPGLIDSYAYELIGDCMLNLNQPEAALDYYTRAANATRALPQLVALRERVASSYVNAGKPLEAVAQYDAILAEAQNAAYRANIMLQAAEVLLSTNDFANSFTRFQVIIRDYPETPAAYRALKYALDAKLDIEKRQQGIIYFANKDYPAAIAAFNDYTAEIGWAPADVLIMLGQSYRALGNTQAAVTSFQTVIDNYPSELGNAWLEQGRTYFLANDIPRAIETYIALATQHPTLPEGAEALWRAGYLYSTQNDATNALAVFDTLVRSYPGTEQARDGLSLAATMAYSVGLYDQAAQLFGPLAQVGNAEQQAAAYLWIGRLYQQDGKDDLARAAYEAAARADPESYTSIRAADLLNGRAPFDPPPAVRFEFDESAQLAEAEAWMRSTFAIEQTGPRYVLSDTLANDPRLVRGRELLAVAQYEDAENEFEALRLELENDPLGTYQLALFLRDHGLYKLSISAAARLITLAGVNTLAAPDLIARLRYPTYYADLVIPESEKNGLDPLLVFALIRQESLFEGFATSFAAAQGLMQIIPDTGQWIADQLGWPPNYQNSDVYRPYINVRFGTYYLGWVMDLVDGVPYAALAGYNGGPGNASQWLAVSGPDLDAFVQTVGFEETRTYVRRIYEQYSIYRELYGVG